MLTKKQKAFLESLAGDDWTIKIELIENAQPSEPDTRITFTALFGYGDNIMSFDVKSYDDFDTQLTTFYENYDPESETYLWLGPDGHGINGAPSSMRTILEDFELFEKKVENVWINVRTSLSELT